MFVTPLLRRTRDVGNVVGESRRPVTCVARGSQVVDTVFVADADDT